MRKMKSLNTDFHHFCRKNAPFAVGNKHTTNDTSSVRLSVISYVLNADSDR